MNALGVVLDGLQNSIQHDLVRAVQISQPDSIAHAGNSMPVGLSVWQWARLGKTSNHLAVDHVYQTPHSVFGVRSTSVIRVNFRVGGRRLIAFITFNSRCNRLNSSLGFRWINRSDNLIMIIHNIDRVRRLILDAPNILLAPVVNL